MDYSKMCRLFAGSVVKGNKEERIEKTMSGKEFVGVERVDKENPDRALEILLNGGTVFEFDGRWFATEKRFEKEQWERIRSALESLREKFSSNE